MDGMLRAAALGALATAIAACDISTGVCATQPLPAIVVDVVDSITNLSAVSGSKLVIRDGAYADSMTANVAFPQLFAGNRGGTFDVTVTRANYEPWVKNDVVVTQDRCRTNLTVNLIARLKPASTT